MPGPGTNAGVPRGVRLWKALGAAVLFILAHGGTLSAQEEETPRRVGLSLFVRIDGLAGNMVYVNAGTGFGFAVGDTFSVATSASPEPGVVTVISASESRSVLGFTSRPVPLTRGTSATLTPLGQTSIRLAELWAVDPPTGPEEAYGFEIARSTLPPRPSLRDPLEFQGRVYLDMTAMRSETEWDGEGIEPGNLTRTFATPSLRMNGSVSNLPGGIRLRTSLRSAYRYSDPALLRASTIRVYEMAAEGALPGGQFRIGRFFNPYESYSGYWDGAVVRMGSGRIGGGAAIGYQPDRWNEGLSTDLRKVSAFVDYRLASEEMSWSGDLSVHRADSEIGVPAHDFVGWSQDGRFGSFRLSQDLQVDRDPDDGGWVVSRLNVSGVLPLSGQLYLNGRYMRRRPYSIFRETDVFSSLRSNAGVGLTWSGAWGSASFDGGVGSLEGMEDSRNVSGSLYLKDPLGMGVDLGTAASYWTREESDVVSLAPSLTRLFGSVRGRATYRFYASNSPWSELRTHGGDMTVNIPLREGWNWSVQAAGQWGGNLTTYRLHTGLSASFP